MKFPSRVSLSGLVTGLLLTLPVVACNGQQHGWLTAPEIAASAEERPTETVVESSYSGIREPTRRLIITSSGWEQFWRQVHDGDTSAPEPPAIDFDQHAVVAAGMGERSSGGYSVAIESVAVSGDTLFAEVRESSPGEGCVVTGALTQPVHAVRSPARDVTTLVTVERESTNTCD